MDAMLLTNRRLVFVKRGRIREAFAVDAPVVAERSAANQQPLERAAQEHQETPAGAGGFRDAFSSAPSGESAARTGTAQDLAGLRPIAEVGQAQHWLRPLRHRRPSLLLCLVVGVAGMAYVPAVAWLPWVIVVGWSVGLRTKNWTGVRFNTDSRSADQGWEFEILVREQDRIRELTTLLSPQVAELQG